MSVRRAKELEKALYYHFMSVRRGFCVHKTSLTLPYWWKCLYKARNVSCHVFVLIFQSVQTVFHSYTTKKYDIKETVSSASFLDIDLICDINGPISTRFYNRGADFNFGNIYFQHLDSNILVARPYGVYISQSSLHSVFRVFTTSRIWPMSTKLWSQGFF